MITVIAYRLGYSGYHDIVLAQIEDDSLIEESVELAHDYWEQRGGKYGVQVTTNRSVLYISSNYGESEPQPIPPHLAGAQ